MLTVRQRRLCMEVPTVLIRSVLDGLRESCNWFITSLKREYLSKLNLQLREDQEEALNISNLPFKPNVLLAGGDFTIDKKCNFYYVKVPADRSYLECGCILKENDISDFTIFCDSIKQTVLKHAAPTKLDWVEINILDKSTREYLTQSCEQLQPDPDELEAARELEQPATRALLSRIITTPESSFLNSFTDILPQNDLIPTMERLERFKLITKSYVVLCRERNREIIKVNTRDAIDDASRKGLKCSMCGRPISDEHIDELLSATPSSMRLLSQHYWMPMRVIDLLMSLGVTGDNIHVEFQENSFVSLYLECGNQLLLLSLIDRPMTLQDAQYLIATIGIHKVKNAVLVSTERIPTLLKTYLKQFNPHTPVFFIDSYVNLQKRLPKILEEILEEQIASITGDFVWLTPVDIQGLVIQSLFPAEQDEQKNYDQQDSSETKRRDTTQVKEPELPKKGRKA